MIPEDIRRLAEERERAREGKDFGLADRLRDRIRAAGFEVADTPNGPSLRPVAPGQPAELPFYTRSQDVPSLLEGPPTARASVEWVVQGWPEDVDRGIAAFRRLESGQAVQHLVVDAAGPLDRSWPEGADVVRLDPRAGFGAARNAGLRRTAGRLVLVVDGSVEPTGDVLGPLEEALADQGVGVTGPFGIVTGDLREFHSSAGPDVDAVEGYVMAFRRDLVVEGLRFDEKFKFYRTADVELSFQIKARGLRATVTPLPVLRHEHRMWANTPEGERARLSKRNFYRFLDRWRARTDLLVSGRPQETGG